MRMNLQIGVKVIIRNSNSKILFIKRTKLLQNESETSWDIPGGRIEPDEALEVALAREVSEELGIVIEGNPMLINAQDIFVSSKDLHVVRLTYLIDTEINPSDIHLSDEHQGIVWLSLEETNTITVEPFLKHTLEKLQNNA